MIIQTLHFLQQLLAEIEPATAANQRPHEAWHLVSASRIESLLQQARDLYATCSEEDRDYVRSGGLVCPQCRSAHLASESLDADGAVATANVRCRHCSTEFVELWELVGIERAEEQPDG